MIGYTTTFKASEDASATPMRMPRIGWQNLLRDLSIQTGQITATPAAAGSSIDAPLRPDTFEYYQPTTMPATWRVDLGANNTANFVGIGGHTFKESEVTVTVEYSADEVTWYPFAIPLSSPDGSPLMWLDYNNSGRFWRWTFDGPLPPKVASIYMGMVLKCTRPLYNGHRPAVLSRVTTLQNSTGRTGQFLGQSIRRRGVRTDAGLSNLDPTWYRDNFDPFVAESRLHPYFWAWRPDKYNEVVYAWNLGDIAPDNSGPQRFMSVAWGMEGLGSD